MHLGQPFRRVRFLDALAEKLGQDPAPLDRAELAALATENGIATKRCSFGCRRGGSSGGVIEAIRSPRVMSSTGAAGGEAISVR